MVDINENSFIHLNFFPKTMLLKNHALDLKFRYGIDKQEEIKSDNVDQNTF